MEESKTNLIVKSLLLSLGFSDKQTKLYLVLLSLGRASASTLIKKSGLKRGITYAILYEFEKDGLVKQFEKDGRAFFEIQSPQKLVDLVEVKKAKINTVVTGLTAMMPELNAEYKKAINRPTVRYFEGEEGILEVFKDIYAPKKEPVYGCADVDLIEKTFPNFLYKNLLPNRVKNKVHSVGIFTDKPWVREAVKNDEKELRESVLIDGKEYPLPAEIDVYEDKIAMLSFTKGEFVGLLIENKDLAESLRSILKLAFNSLSGNGKGQ